MFFNPSTPLWGKALIAAYAVFVFAYWVWVYRVIKRSFTNG